MQLGGNARFREFLKKYKLGTMSIHKKYRTSAAKYYREYLDALENGEVPGQAPELGEGAKVENGSSQHLRVEIQGFGSDDLAPKTKKRSRSRFKEGWEKGKRKMEKWGKNISKKFGKIFRRSKSKKKKKPVNNSTNDDVSASNDSYFEIDDMRKQKQTRQNRFDDDLISFKKSRNEEPGKPFLGWKHYLEKPSGSKFKANYKKKIRTFKSQTSGTGQENYLQTPPVENQNSYSDYERKFDGKEKKEKQKKSGKKMDLDSEVQNPFQKKNLASDGVSIQKGEILKAIN